MTQTLCVIVMSTRRAWVEQGGRPLPELVCSRHHRYYLYAYIYVRFTLSFWLFTLVTDFLHFPWCLSTEQTCFSFCIHKLVLHLKGIICNIIALKSLIKTRFLKHPNFVQGHSLFWLQEESHDITFPPQSRREIFICHGGCLKMKTTTPTLLKYLVLFYWNLQWPLYYILCIYIKSNMRYCNADRRGFTLLRHL